MDSRTNDFPRRSRRIRWQISLQSLAWLLVLWVLLCAPGFFFGLTGWMVSFALLAVGIFVIGMNAGGLARAGALACVVVVGTLALWTVHMTVLCTPNSGGYRARCMNNLKMIALALRQYEVEHGAFPPAYIADENGQPMHSWRVLILPYLEERRLYDAYRFDEPWDGPNNRELHDRMPSVYQCLCDATDQPNTTEHASYLAVVGEQTIWPREKGKSLRSVRDGAWNTILVVEVHNSGVHWMEPRDLDFETMSATVNSGPVGRTVSSQHSGGALVAFADGHVKFLQADTPGDVLQAMLTSSGGEVLPVDFP